MNGSFSCHIDQPQPNSPSGGTLQLWSRGPCQSANINLSSKKKKKMPNASRTRCRDTDELSLALSRKRELETVDAFQALNSPSLSPQTGCSSRPLTSSPLEVGWKLLHQKSSQSLSLLTRSRCHPVKCIV